MASASTRRPARPRRAAAPRPPPGGGPAPRPAAPAPRPPARPTQPRAVNRRTWVYRILPSARHPAFHRIDNSKLKSTPFDELEPDPNRLRWNPLPLPSHDQETDFIDGLFTVAGNGDVRQ